MRSLERSSPRDRPAVRQCGGSRSLFRSPTDSALASCDEAFPRDDRRADLWLGVSTPLAWRATHDRSHVSQHVQSSFQGARRFHWGSLSTAGKVVHTTLHNLWITTGPSSSARGRCLNTCESRSPLSLSARRRREADLSGPWLSCQPLFSVPSFLRRGRFAFRRNRRCVDSGGGL